MSRAHTPQWTSGPCSFVIPVHNEAETIETTVAGILAAIDGAAGTEIVLVENGSSDNTYAIASQLAADHQQVRCLRESVAGYGNAVRRGILDAQNGVVVVFDCDLWDMAFAADAVDIAGRDATVAVVVASKRCAGATDRRPVLRRAGTLVFTCIVRIICGLRASDTHGMKLLRVDRVRRHIEASAGAPHTFDTEVIVRCERDGWRIGELPCVVDETRPARSGFLRRVPSTLAGVYQIRRRVRATGQ